MRLRHRLLVLFGVFALVPLLAMGIFDYARSLRHLEAVLGAQTQGIAARAAEELKDRLDLQRSDIGLLSDNVEVQRLLRMTEHDGPPARSAAKAAADRYWQELWRNMRLGYERLALYDAKGNQLLLLATEVDPTPIVQWPGTSRVHEIRDPETGRPIGRLEFTPRIGDLFQHPVFRSAFGAEGRTLVIDREARRILLEPTRHPTAPPDTLFGFDHVAGARGTFTYDGHDARRVASFVSFDDPAWTVLVTASLDEFASPFIRLRLLDLAVLLAVIAAVSLGFFLLLRRATASLDRITLAADRVGRGDFNPALPPIGSDEMGRLSAAFSLMTTRVREMIAQVEASRQMGVLGRFATELSHEIRNPLTAIKINLQGLERDAREGRIPDESRRAVEMALREIRRLDLAVKAALKTGRPPSEPRPLRYLTLLHEAVELVRPQAAGLGIAVHHTQELLEEQYTGDPEAIRGSLLNLLLNAVEAMPSGGNLWVEAANVETDAMPMLEIRIRDDGCGIPADLRDRVFRPFFTTKGEGTGLGLSLALQTFRAHGGTLTLGDPARGAEVIVRLPVRAAPVPA